MYQKGKKTKKRTGTVYDFNASSVYPRASAYISPRHTLVDLRGKTPNVDYFVVALKVEATLAYNMQETITIGDTITASESSDYTTLSIPVSYNRGYFTDLKVTLRLIVLD